MPILFLAIVLFLDFVFFPSFGVYNSALASLYLISFVLNFGIDKKSILFIFLAALLIEFLLGYTPGLYSGSFLISILLLFLASKAFNVPVAKNSSPLTYVGLSFIGLVVNYLIVFIFISISGYLGDEMNYSFYRALSPINVLYLAEIFLLLICLNLKKNTRFP